MAKIAGKVNWFNVAKGFGFITRDDGEGDVFVHQSDLHAEGFRSLREGEGVEFAIETGEDGRNKAVNVTGPEGACVQGAPRRVGYGRGRGRGGRGGFRGRGGRGAGDERSAEGGPAADGQVPAEPSGLQVVVLNLPWSVSWQTLKDHFQGAGKVVRADVVTDVETGRSRGFGTVSFETQEEAQLAIEQFNSTEFESRTITVRLDKYV
mmetsp:Transcript_2319/g.2588  ORF Transcript_2319/g.2588 Transcript_2319/m.2588 type:complete len:207 (-) Transcript_2319:324-944(-)|eukprot:CAMPEP_0197859868 /NCGR_PEP_ID=MMETSP1438-20131217/34816_1 /TAXON_ID=1461541 /ORGANISM="Pterosperma sp., Strain CCMP1384" /LENGTH=206 /DNA_ID=CAMNT_0043476537 /DNA_START=134 /DNA_END=754 /DNA_ORIENTATION=+